MMVGTSIMVGTSTTVVNSSTVPGMSSATARVAAERVVADAAETCTAVLGLSSLRLVIKHLLFG
jgi:hypothetical protein